MYVALSRVHHADSIRVLVDSCQVMDEKVMATNVVFKELLTNV